MAFQAKILADSVGSHGIRLTTFELTFPRCILAEFNTHRMKSSNAASSRAIPVKTLIKKIKADPFIPVFAFNQKGMQSAEPLTGWQKWIATKLWLFGMHFAILLAKIFLALNIHKQFVNRLLEPWMWVTVIASATEWNNLFALRVHPKAEPSFQKIAGMMWDMYSIHKPKKLLPGEWHRPLIDGYEERAITEVAFKLFPDTTSDPDEMLALGYPSVARKRGPGVYYEHAPIPENAEKRKAFITEQLNQISVGRCARVSYLTHDGKRDFKEDIKLHDFLCSSRPGHWSPFEHVAQCQKERIYRGGNFTGWKQYRKFFADENIKNFGGGNSGTE